MDSRNKALIEKGHSALDQFLIVAAETFPSWPEETKHAYLSWLLAPICEESALESLALFGLKCATSFEEERLGEAKRMDIPSYIRFEDAALHVVDILHSYLNLNEWDCRKRMETIKKDRVDRMLDYYPVLISLKS